MIIGYLFKIVVEYLVIFNEWFDKDCLVLLFWIRSFIGCLYVRYVQFDFKVDNFEFVEELDDFEGFVYGFDVEMLIVIFIYSIFFVLFVVFISIY